MTKDEAIARLVGKVRELSENLLNAAEMFEESEQYTLEEHEEAKALCVAAEGALRARISELETELAESQSVWRDKFLKAVSAVRMLSEVVNMLMPGAKHIFGLDIGSLNDKLVQSSEVVAEGMRETANKTPEG